MRTGLLWLVLLAARASAGEVIDATVQHVEGRYFVAIDAWLDAPSTAVYAVLQNYDNQSRLSPNIVESRVLFSRTAESHRTRHVLQSCVLFFCRRMVKVQDVVELGDGVIIATVVPEGSDFHDGQTRWHVRPEARRTRLTYEGNLRPAFWIPPFIGPYLIERRLRSDTLQSVERLEELARQSSPQ